MAAPVAAVGDEGDAGGVVRHHPHVGRVHAVGPQPSHDTLAEVVGAHHPDDPGGRAEAGDGAGEYRRRPAGEGPHQLAWAVERHVEFLAHDLDQELAQGQDAGRRGFCHGHSATVRGGSLH